MIETARIPSKLIINQSAYRTHKVSVHLTADLYMFRTEAQSGCGGVAGGGSASKLYIRFPKAVKPKCKNRMTFITPRSTPYTQYIFNKCRHTAWYSSENCSPRRTTRGSAKFYMGPARREKYMCAYISRAPIRPPHQLGQ